MRLAFLSWITLFLGFILITIVCTSAPAIDLRKYKPEVNPKWTASYDGTMYVAISLPHRLDSHFYPLQRRLKAANLDLFLECGINGKEINMDDFPLSKQYRDFFEDNIRKREAGETTIDYRGHLGCTLTHIGVIRAFAASESLGSLMIMEDDPDPTPDFATTWPAVVKAVNAHDPEWDLLLGGYSARYGDHPWLKINDMEAIYEPGFVKLHYWIGGWSYLIRNTEVARKILKEFEPKINWHIDLTMAEATRLGRLNTYGSMPILWRHPGSLRASSWDHVQVGDIRRLKSDTNH